MKAGVNLINYGEGATPGSLARWGKLVEALGYHLLMVSDHVATTPDVQAEYPAPFYDPFVTLAWLAGSTSRIELGTTVVVLPYRHPLQVAGITETVERLSGGRFILGVGPFGRQRPPQVPRAAARAPSRWPPRTPLQSRPARRSPVWEARTNRYGRLRL